MGFTSVPRAKKRRRSEKAEEAANSAGRGRTEFARICIRRAILARAKLDVKPGKKGWKNEAVGCAREREGPKKRMELSEPVALFAFPPNEVFATAACTCAALEFNDVSTISATPSVHCA